MNDGFGRVVLAIFDVTGREVIELYSGEASPGAHEVRWDGRSRSGSRLPGGVYFYRMTTARGVEQKKLLLLP